MDSVTTTPDDRHRYRVLGIPVDVCRDVQAAAIGLHARGGGRIVTLNAEMTMTARTLPELGHAIEGADLVIPDGAGVVWALARQRVSVVKTAGIELAWTLLGYAAAHGWRVALVGAAPAVMDRLRTSLPERLPGLNLVMAVDGYQPAEAWDSIEAQLKRLKPDLVLVALGVPRQETWSERLGSDQQGLWMGVGGSFDVWAGVKRRAPAWMCRYRVEWLYRLIQEPTRWRRMLSLPAFAWAVLKGR
ncbi:N-acetylglucosaminyldiphosphoundecaprenol N-acetyl-beta-D-mannosaminyltransferase [Synechococcus sp. A15-28]|nr:N-acetylglucosaminyldiphosphoundecaprenol N-acetyl-beta-D-mannosaminyltransferase [Synechococcus sp. A15-28]